MEFISENFKTLLLALIGMFAGIAITIKIKRGNKTGNSNKVKQKIIILAAILQGVTLINRIDD